MKVVRMLIGGLLSGIALSVAAAYPDKPIRVIVPYPPGGLTDAVARQVGGAPAERFKQPVVIENVPGSGGEYRGEQVKRS